MMHDSEKLNNAVRVLEDINSIVKGIDFTNTNEAQITNKLLQIGAMANSFCMKVAP